jgi:catechol 2,3-dioxygenase-like lactoylglutathione lyase family enzyme
MLPATLRLGAVHLNVSNLGRSVAFYEDAVGLRLHLREDGAALREALARRRIFFMISGAEDRDGIKPLL